MRKEHKNVDMDSASVGCWKEGRITPDMPMSMPIGSG